MGALELFVERSPFADDGADDTPNVELSPAALSPEECAMLLGSGQVGRIAVSIGALPVILPVNYLAMDGSVWFRARSDGILLRAALGSVVAFEADGYEEVGAFGWSVLVRGVAEEIRDQRKLAVAKASFIDAWPRAEYADRFIVIPATMLSGQRYARLA
jgi:nitroimidazol reductase NimA-like FMN-containing flavoprotein (pyridoxamine 5'-phosphate oxidase superfamily)